MRVRPARIRLGLALAGCGLLAACAVAPARHKPKPPAVVMARPEPPPTIVQQLPATIAPGHVWTYLTKSFVMHDCADSPLIRANEAMYTRWPAHFEQLLQRSLPLMLYVHQQLQAAGIPGEFVMLPMLESSYDPGIFNPNGNAAGMWQLMPHTARVYGLKINRHYDGRLNPVASTRAAIKLLKTLKQKFGNWRLVDMAYYAGPLNVQGALNKHRHDRDLTIPDLEVTHGARTHLARLLALSCILRDPAHFDVKLPQPTPGDILATTQVPAGTALSAVAEMAGLPEARVHALNPGYFDNVVPAHSPRTVLLPADATQTLVAALTIRHSESVAEVDTGRIAAGPGADPMLPGEPTETSDASDPPPAPHAFRKHIVRRGESLSSIAQRFHVSVHDLKRWNHLRGDLIRSGQVLRVGYAHNAASDQHHRVRKGESLWSIAHRFHVSVHDLKRWNHLTGNMVRPGEILKVQG